MAAKRHKKQLQTLIITGLAVLLGVAIMVAANTTRVEEQGADKTTQELIDYIEQLEADTATLEARIAATRQRIDDIQNQSAEGETLLSSLNDRLQELNQYAGLTPLAGRGLVITLNDNTIGAELAQKSNPASYNAENYLVHDKDLLYIVRALASASEAVSINGVRVIDTTSIRCAGTVILINSSRLSPPYEISIIGDPDRLVAALKSSSRYYRLVYNNIPITYTASESITVPAYTGVYNTTYSSLVSDRDADAQ